jgi:RND superfamily putative drug exporter
VGDGPGRNARAVAKPTWLARTGSLITRRPRRIIAAWLVVVGLLTTIGLGLEDELSIRADFIDGTAAARGRQIVTQEFGGENAVVVLLRGPEARIEAQGKRLEQRLEAIPDALVLSPWAAGTSIDGLHPRPGAAALVVNVRSGAEAGLLDILPIVRRGIADTVRSPVRASVAGSPAIFESLQSATERSVELGQWIAIPALFLVLLLVFRSVLAAVAPVVIGGAVVAASRGVLDLLGAFVHLDSVALGVMGMMGLALGVDYSLLVVSRFREEVRGGSDISEAVQSTVAATSRTVLMAGSGLSLAMLVAAQVLPGEMITSVAIAVIATSALSVLSAMFVAPALLMVVGAKLDRWSLPQRRGGEGWAMRWSKRLSARPGLVAVPLVFLLVFASAWALTLDTGFATVALLPEGDRGRQSQEVVQHELGPGWVSPLEIVMADRSGPVTTSKRLRALADFQHHLERDPGVATMTGFAGLERTTRQLDRFEEGLFAQQRGSAKLSRGLSKVHEGANLNTSGLQRAADGASRLGSALSATHGGAAALAKGIGSAGGGSNRLASGLSDASGGSGKVADGTANASEGAGRLSEGLERASNKTEQIQRTASSLESTMRTGEQRSDEVGASIGTVDARLLATREALQRMTVGRDDPEFAAALEGVEAAALSLTGIDPVTGQETEGNESVAAGLRGLRGQFDLGLYLSEHLSKKGEEATDGVTKLTKGSAKLDDGLAKLSKGSERLSEGIAKLAEGGRALPPGLGRLQQGAERLTSGLGQVEQGAGGLANGLGSGAQKSTLLAGALGKLDKGVERSRGEPGNSKLDRLHRRSPGLFDSGYFFLASLDGSHPSQRQQAGFLISLERGGSAARMLVIPRFEPSDSRAAATRDRLEDDAAALARETGTEVVVGGVTPAQLDIDAAFRSAGPHARLALALVTMLILFLVVRSLLVPVLAALLNLLTLAATFGFLALLFDGSLLGGPGYVDVAVIPATIMVVFGLAIDYEVFIFARMREEYLRTGSPEAAVANGLAQTAPVVTGAAIIMIIVFLAFAISPFATMRNFGVAQAIGVAIDAFLIRLIIVPALMRWMGPWAWWTPRWLERMLPGADNDAAPVAVEGAR